MSSLRPNVRTYSLVMNAWANVAGWEAAQHGTHDAAARCERILNRMEERAADGDAAVRPNLVTYVTAITAWARAATHDPDSGNAAASAEGILDRLIDLFYGNWEEGTAAGAREPLEGGPDGPSAAAPFRHDAPFNAVITAYARSPASAGGARRALAVLARLEAAPIDATVTSYNAALDCCAKHGAPELAREVLARMGDRGVVPDATSYDTALNAFARDDAEGAAARAWDFLRRLEEERAAGVETRFVPSRVSYATVLNAFARASGNRYHGGLHLVVQAKDIYERLLEQIEEGVISGKADTYANSCFLNCCANLFGRAPERRQALVLAITAFEDMKERPHVTGTPNHYTFGTMMKVCVRLSSDAAEQHRLMESLFVQACKRGLLSVSVLAQFLRHTPSHLSMKVVVSLGGSKREIPESWYRNVPRTQWPPGVTDNGDGNYFLAA